MTRHPSDYIVFPLDLPSIKEAVAYTRLLDGHVGMFKIGLELFIDQGPDAVRKIKEASSARIFLDLKLHDISATVFRAMGRVAELGVDLVTVHGCSSAAMLEKAVAGGQGKTGVLGVTLLTDNDAASLAAGGYKDQYIDNPGLLVMQRAAMICEAGCAGVVCSGQEAAQIKERFGKSFLAVTPGIRPEWSLLEKDDQKRVTTPAQAVRQGSDYIVIGRPIRDADDPVKAAVDVAAEIQTVFDKK